MTISEIQKMPSCWKDEKNKYHESVLKCFHIVELVREMLERGDSNKTILMVIEECKTRTGEEFFKPREK